MEVNGSKVPQEESYIEVYQDYDVPTARVPYDIARDKRVKGNAVKLFILYFEVAENWKGTDPKRVDPTRMSAERANLVCQSKIADDLGYHKITVCKLTRLLHNTGWITIKRTGRSNIIILHGFPKRRRSVK